MTECNLSFAPPTWVAKEKLQNEKETTLFMVELTSLEGYIYGCMPY